MPAFLHLLKVPCYTSTSKAAFFSPALPDVFFAELRIGVVCSAIGTHEMLIGLSQKRPASRVIGAFVSVKDNGRSWKPYEKRV